MADGRRHSVDIPISRTLIALRRVRSLRDPSTSSLSKFSALLDNVNWEANSSNGISLRFMNSDQEGGSDHNGHLGSKFLGLNGLREGRGDDFELLGGLEESKSKLVTYESLDLVGNSGIPVRTKQVEVLKDYGSNQEENHVIDHSHRGLNKSSERYCSNLRDKELDLAFIMPSSNHLEDVDSSNGPIVGSSPLERIDHYASKRKSGYKNRVKSSGAMGDITSRVGSPCLSASDALSSRSISLFANEEVDGLDYNYHGCGISCCWSRTPKFRGSNPPSDVEDHPLLSGDLSETALNGQKRWKHINDKITPYSETPRSLSQKFRPKSFNDLVGQNVVVRSLLGAISRERVTSFYLFHGPRGTGKTSASRIFAAALNCLSTEENKPCGLCRECLLFFSGRSKDVKEVDSVRINRTDRVRSLIKNAVIPPVSSRFKIFIIDECQLLQGETWATVLNSLENLSQHVVFVMITPDLDKLPRSAVSRSQRHHFPKIKDADIASRLEKICVEEGLDFDQVVLDFIAAKSNGSLRDAEMMLEQLSLLGKKITMSSAHALIGIVSDDELLDLLDLALSSDTSNTVIRARELMKSRIDPMQLISQLANLIMDILAGKCQEGSCEARRKFSRRHTSEVELQKLSHALKILSETEKQLRMSKNQTTWLTVALLQLSHVEASSSDANNTKLCLRDADKDDFYSTSSTGGSSKHLVTCSSDKNKSHKLGTQEEFKGTLASIWKKATGLCQSSSLKNFLRKHGKLSSLCVNQGLAVAELEFHHPDYVSRAEKSWKLIAGSLQAILGSNVEIRINLVFHAPVSKGSKVWKPSFSLFSCSRRMQHKSQLTTKCGSDSDYSDYTSEKPMTRDTPMLTCSLDCGSQMSHNCCHRMGAVTALRNSEGNVLSTGTTLSHRSLQDDTPKNLGNGVDSSKVEGSSFGFQVLSIQETENQPRCFPRTLRLKKKSRLADTSQMIYTSDQQQNNLALSFPRDTSFETYTCASDHYVFRSSFSNNYSNSSRDGDGLREKSDVLCWRTPSFHPRKSWELLDQRRRSPLVGWVLSCGSAK